MGDAEPSALPGQLGSGYDRCETTHRGSVTGCSNAVSQIATSTNAASTAQVVLVADVVW